MDAREIANQLSVNTILEGSVRKAGNKVRISAQLINSADGYHVWSDVYDRNLEDIFEVQDDISAIICNVCSVKISTEESANQERMLPGNHEAYDMVLKGSCLN